MTLLAAILLLASCNAYVFPSGLLISRSSASTAAAASSLYMAKTPLVANGKRFEAEEGSSMLAACAKLGLKVPTKCKKGECGTCTVTAGGKKIRACIGKVPDAPRLKSLLEKGLVVTVDNA